MDANGIGKSEDPDQAAPLGAVQSWSALFVQTYLSKNFGSLRYAKIKGKQLVVANYHIGKTIDLAYTYFKLTGSETTAGKCYGIFIFFFFLN